MSGIPEQDRADHAEMFSPEGATKVLGVAWDVQQDSFHFKVDNLEPQESYTKAQMLSIVASIFDPLSCDHSWNDVVPGGKPYEGWLETETTQ